MHKNKTNSERKMPKNPQVSKRLSKFGIKGALNNTNLMNLCDGYKLSSRGTRNEMIERIVKHLKDTYGNDDNNDESSPRLTDASGTSSSGDSSGTSGSDNNTGTSGSDDDTSSEEDNNNENEDSLENILNVSSEDDADDNISIKKLPVDVRFTFFLNGKNITKIDSLGPRAKLTLLTSYGIERTIESTVDAAEDFGSLIDMSDKNCKYDVLRRNDKLRWYVSNPFNTKAKLELSDYNDNGVEDEIERLANKGQGFVLDIIIPLKKRFIVEIDNHAIEELSNPSNNRKKSNNNTSTTTTTTTKSTDDEKRLVKIHLLSGGAVEQQNSNQVYATNSTAERSFTFDIGNATLKKIKGVLLFGKDTKLFCQALHVKPKPHAKKVETIDNDEHLKSILEEASAKNKELYFVFNLLSESSLNKKTVDVEYLANVDYENLVIEKVKKHSSFNESNEVNELIQVIDTGIEKLYHDANSCIYHGYSQRTRMTYMRELRQFKKTELLRLVTAVKDLNFSFGGFKSNITICKNQFKPDKHGGIPVQLSSASGSSGSSSGALSNFKEEYFKEALEEKHRIRKRELEIREEELALKKRKLDQENGNYATTGNNNTGTTSPFEKKLKAIERVCALNCPDEYKRKLLDQIEANPQYQDSNTTEEE